MRRVAKSFRPRWGSRLAVALLLGGLWGCGDGGVEPDAELARLVGRWDATALVLTNVANPVVAPDLVELGAEFTLDIQPSGQYTAVLVFALQSQTEIGQITVSGNAITLRPEFPAGSPPTRGVYSVTETTLTVDGDTEFDFNLDGTPEAARAHFELVRSDG